MFAVLEPDHEEWAHTDLVGARGMHRCVQCRGVLCCFPQLLLQMLLIRVKTKPSVRVPLGANLDVKITITRLCTALTNALQYVANTAVTTGGTRVMLRRLVP